MAEVDKSLLAFLNGLSKRIIFRESGNTDEFLRNEVLGGISDEGLLRIINVWLRGCMHIARWDIPFPTTFNSLGILHRFSVGKGIARLSETVITYITYLIEYSGIKWHY